MRLSKIFEAGGVIVRPQWETFEQAVRGMVTQLASSGQLDPGLEDAAVVAICERESADSTAIVEIGVSIPHARLDGIHGLVSTLATSPTSLYLEAAGVPIRLMAVVLSAPELAAEHLRFLSSLSMLLQSRMVRRALREAPDSAAVLAVLRRYEGA